MRVILLMTFAVAFLTIYGLSIIAATIWNVGCRVEDCTLDPILLLPLAIFLVLKLYFWPLERLGLLPPMNHFFFPGLSLAWVRPLIVGLVIYVGVWFVLGATLGHWHGAQRTRVDA